MFDPFRVKEQKAEIGLFRLDPFRVLGEMNKEPLKY